MMKHLDEDVPPVFMILDTFDKDVKSLVSTCFRRQIQWRWLSNYTPNQLLTHLTPSAI